MKHILITTIAAVLVVGCGKPSNPAADRALISAAGCGDVEAVRQALASGANVNATIHGGYTALHKAVRFGHLLSSKEIAELLIANGADVNVINEFGKTTLDWATGECAEIIRKHGGKTGEELKAEAK